MLLIVAVQFLIANLFLLQVMTPFFKNYFSRDANEEEKQKITDEVKAGLNYYETELRKRGTKFFFGEYSRYCKLTQIKIIG